MRRNRFSIYLTFQAVVIAAVMVIFRTIPDRKIAATLAGFLFVGLPLALMIYENKKAGWTHKLWFAAALQFWLLFALPILGLRLFNWDIDFNQLSLLGIPGPFLHEWSSKSYMLWMVATLVTSWRAARSEAVKEV